MKSAHTVALLALLLVASFARAAGTDVVTRAIRGEFEDVKTRVTLSIEGRGLVVNYTSRVGDMLQRTGKDIGSSVRIYARAEVLEPFARYHGSRSAQYRLLSVCHSDLHAAS
jgi:hypothetical protein